MNNNKEERSPRYKKNQLEEKVLFEMNQTLYEKELDLIKNFDKPRLPVIFIVGAQRSGTTLLMQLITQLYKINYPTNFIARYWQVPYIGNILYHSLLWHTTTEKKPKLESDLGYTSGIDGPHEFGYFWRRWFPWEIPTQKKYDEIDYSILLKELDAWQSINNLPIIFKNLLQVDYNIEFLYKIIPKAFFIFVKRDLAHNAYSTYNSRIKLFNDSTKWLGVKPSNYNALIKLDVFEQIVKQILTINNDIEKQLVDIPKNNVIRINYEDLIDNYKREIKKITDKIYLTGEKIKQEFRLISANKINLKNEIFDKILNQVKKYSD